MTDHEQVQINYTLLDGPKLLEALGDDAMKWAIAFKQHANLQDEMLDVGFLLCWFANAIEHSSAVRSQRSQPQMKPFLDRKFP